jgi:hypothetical protein
VGVTLWGKHRLRVSGNRELRSIFGHKREEVTGGCRKLHNMKICSLYFSPNINCSDQIKEDEMGRTCNMHGRVEIMHAKF